MFSRLSLINRCLYHHRIVQNKVTQWREQSLAPQDGGNSAKSYGAIALRWEKGRGF
jgi:hypothetical protein